MLKQNRQIQNTYHTDKDYAVAGQNGMRQIHKIQSFQIKQKLPPQEKQC